MLASANFSAGRSLWQPAYALTPATLPFQNGRTWEFWQRRPVAAMLEHVGDGCRTPKLARLEAVLLVSNGPLSPRKLAQFATLADATEARTLCGRLNDLYDAAGTAFRIEQIAAGYQLLTRPKYSFWLAKLHQREAELKLTPAALETLTIVAYRQPITRADIEAIRGVGSVEMLKQLMDRGLVKLAGADDSLGRPHLYETTRKFLETYGFRNLTELPMSDRLRPSNTRSQGVPEDNAEAA